MKNGSLRRNVKFALSVLREERGYATVRESRGIAMSIDDLVTEVERLEGVVQGAAAAFANYVRVAGGLDRIALVESLEDAVAFFGGPDFSIRDGDRRSGDFRRLRVVLPGNSADKGRRAGIDTNRRSEKERRK